MILPTEFILPSHIGPFAKPDTCLYANLSPGDHLIVNK